jgi:hypothetical protein
MAGLLSGLTLLLLVGGLVLFWLLGDPAPGPQVQFVPVADTPGSGSPEAPIANRAAETSHQHPAGAESRQAIPAQPTAPPAIDLDTYLPPPPVLQERPPAEGEEGETIPPAYRHADLSGQALMVHRDLELTLRVLHDLAR